MLQMNKKPILIGCRFDIYFKTPHLCLNTLEIK
jgi:hypothetical protein